MIIAQIGHPILRKQTKTISQEELATKKIQSIIDKLIFTMREFNGAGLAANQIYEPYRICVLEVLENERYAFLPNIPLTVLVNPRVSILNKNIKFYSYEGCLSVPNLRGRVERFCEIHVDALDRYGNKFSKDFYGLAAIVYQHVIDHLDGVLFTDRLIDKGSLTTYDNFKNYHLKDYENEIKKLNNQYEFSQVLL